MGLPWCMVVESARVNDETNVCHTDHKNSSGMEQAQAGKHVGLGTLVRTIMSLPFTCNQSSQRSVSTVVLIKHEHLPMVSGTWHFPDRSMCADSVSCTHTLSLRFLGNVKPYLVQALKTNMFGLHRAYWTLPGSTELWTPEMVGIFRCNRGTIHRLPLKTEQ